MRRLGRRQGAPGAAPHLDCSNSHSSLASRFGLIIPLEADNCRPPWSSSSRRPAGELGEPASQQLASRRLIYEPLICLPSRRTDFKFPAGLQVAFASPSLGASGAERRIISSSLAPVPNCNPARGPRLQRPQISARRPLVRFSSIKRPPRGPYLNPTLRRNPAGRWSRPSRLGSGRSGRLSPSGWAQSGVRRKWRSPGDVEAKIKSDDGRHCSLSR